MLGPRRVFRDEQALDEGGVLLDDPRATPDLHSRSVVVVDEEQERLVVLGEVARRDVLPVAAKLGPAERVLVEDPDEALRASAVLHVRATRCTRGGEVRAVAPGDEPGQLVRDLRPEPAVRLDSGVHRSRALALLDCLDGRRERDVARWSPHVVVLRHRGSGVPSRRTRVWSYAAFAALVRTTGKSISVSATWFR